MASFSTASYNAQTDEIGACAYLSSRHNPRLFIGRRLPHCNMPTVSPALLCNGYVDIVRQIDSM